MPTPDPRIDAYIESAAPFAKPILKHLRQLVHRTCPDAVETIKWGKPTFEYHGILCGCGAFKAHAYFLFWHPSIREAHRPKKKEGMGHLGRILSLDDLPSDASLARQIRAAMKLNVSGTKSRRPTRPAKPPPRTPADLAKLLKLNPTAAAFFKSLAPSCKREYIDYITEAKRPETRQKRLTACLANLLAGRKHNWQYM